MSKEIGLIIDAISKSSRFLRRDYLEIEKLQSTKSDLKKFYQRTYKTLLRELNYELGRYYNSVVFVSDNGSDSDSNSIGDFKDEILLIDSLDCSINFNRSLPFFGLFVILLKKYIDTVIVDKAIIYLPIEGDVFYVEKGKPVLSEKNSNELLGRISRMRLLKSDDIDNIVVSSDIESIEIAKKISSNIRIFGSISYSVAAFISGKIDVCIMSCNINQIYIRGLSLFTHELGAIYKILNNTIVIVSNYSLYKKIAQII
ncbi:FIG domain-containing protein [Rickettsia endosymbiont of Cardiosporidium cionae]|uniref:hypothetical protein n=1 Tax=Rickettsia endosymbiont of Cardiosporidium cionae TaxID=2777155 RepID=UPI0018936450|nr:hypothetical protein [Rickettsia endosymbiont of Cardiosporidium cionae]KAF8818338.1 inositol monophosphatase [Rickettsia endosymbiont of Cardiosporidium cionae]